MGEFDGRVGTGSSLRSARVTLQVCHEPLRPSLQRSVNISEEFVTKDEGGLPSPLSGSLSLWGSLVPIIRLWEPRVFSGVVGFCKAAAEADFRRVPNGFTNQNLRFWHPRLHCV